MIRAEVRYTREHFKALANNSKNTRSVTVCVYLIAAVNLFAAAFQIWNGSVSGAVGNMIFMAFCLWYILYMKVIFPKSAVKKYEQRFPDAVIAFTFSEESVHAETNGSGYSENMDYGYDKFLQITEDDRFFFLYVNKNSAYIIGKHEITEGTPEALRELFKKKMGSKFKIRK